MTWTKKPPPLPPGTSIGAPRYWDILREGARIGYVVCPDAHTAEILATFRYGVGVTLHQGQAG